jgi:hypothetical protein
MIRSAVVVIFLAVACAALAQDKDPVKEKLAAAKAAYDGELQQFRKAVGEWLDKREADARKDGDRKVVEQVKEERKAFEAGELPKGAPAAIQQKPAQAKKAMESAYAEALQAYTKANRDDAAAVVLEEWQAFSAKPFLPKSAAIDLLALIDPKTHTVWGVWKKDGKVLVSVAGGRPPRLQIPYEPGEEYDLEVSCKRVEGNNSFNVGLVAGGRQFLAAFDGWPTQGYMSGLDFVDGKDVRNNPTTLKGPQFENDKNYTLGYSVRSGKIETSINGKVIVSYKGEFNRLSLGTSYRTPSDKALILFLGPHTSYHIDRIMLTPVKGKGTIIK